MTTELLLVQLLVLGATGVLFWLARRDLTSRASSVPPPPDTRELEQLCVTLEALVTDLSRRLDRVERQAAQVAPALVPPAPNSGGAGKKLDGVGVLLAAPSDSAKPKPPLRLGEGGEIVPGRGLSAEEAPDARYAPVYALLDAGETDPQEIARRTDLSRGEVDLILSLRARRAL